MNKLNLGSLVINQFLDTLKNNKDIEPKITLTNQGKLATGNLIKMIDSLSSSDDTTLYNFIKNNYKLPISVLSNDKNGKINAKFSFKLPLNLKKIAQYNDTNILSQLSESGVYIFLHNNGKYAIGSAMNFKRRLVDHINSFRGHRIKQNLHKFTKDNGGLNSITWSPIIITPNFYKLFNSIYPNYVLNENELNLLTAITQYMPTLRVVY